MEHTKTEHESAHPVNWPDVERLVGDALQVAPAERSQWLAKACGSDEALLAEVASLLAYEDRADQLVPAALNELVGAAKQPESAGQILCEGAQVGPYRICSLIGKGGMGEVYRAEDTRLWRHVALKFLPARYRDSDDALERFRREAQAVSSLNHPNICMLFDVGEHEGQPFLVMELMEGVSLKQRLEGGALSMEDVLSVGIHVCSALEAAHAKDVVHRDIKPANIFINATGTIKILDFGLAKLRSTGAVSTPSARITASGDCTITIAGMAMGTASYMSPEQARGEDVDCRSDLFSLGVVLYHLATGARPFSGDTPASAVAGLLSEKPLPPRERNAHVPEELGRIILRALEKDRDARFQTAADLRAALEHVRDRIMFRRRRIIRGVTAGIAIAIIAAVAEWIGRLAEPNGLPNLVRRDVTSNPAEDPVIRGTISPDGQRVAFMDLAGLHVRNVDSGATQSFLPAKGCCFR